MDIEAVNSLIDDYKILIESYRKENKHLRELQRNMDKQYQELEEKKQHMAHNYTKYIQERDNNWNELKEWLEKEHEEFFNRLPDYAIAIENLVDKMQEIESGKNE